MMDNLNETTTFPTDVSTNSDDSEDDGIIEYEVPYLLTVIVIASIGNIIVLVIYSKKSRRQSNAALYIINLAIGDMFAVGVAVFHVTEFFPSTWPYLWKHDIQCILHRWARYTAFNITVFTMVAIAIDRYFAVCKPILFKTKCTLKRTKVIIVLMWIFAVLCSIFESFNAEVRGDSTTTTSDSGSKYVEKTNFACKSSSPWGDWFRYLKLTYVNGLLFYLPVIITFTMYVCIIIAIWKRRKHGVVKNSTSRNSNVHIRTTRTLFIVFIAYVGCYVWFASYKIVLLFDKDNLTATLKSLGNMIPFVNSCLNPIIYSFTNVTFRKHLVELFCTKFGSNAPAEQSDDSKAMDSTDGSKYTLSTEADSNCNVESKSSVI